MKVFGVNIRRWQTSLRCQSETECVAVSNLVLNTFVPSLLPRALEVENFWIFPSAAFLYINLNPTAGRTIREFIVLINFEKEMSGGFG